MTAEPLRADETFEDVLALFRAGQTRCAAVIDENGALAGVVTFTDLIRATNRGAGLRTPVREIMTAHPACVTLSDSPELAVSTMRSHRLKWLPVVENLQGRRLVGWIHAQKLLERAMLDTSHALDKT